MGKTKKTLFYTFGTAITLFCIFFCINLMVHAEGIVVTPETFEDYYSVEDQNYTAILKPEVQADEITFQGDFSDVLAGKVNRIVADRAIAYTGQDAVFKDVYFEVSADNVSISGFSFNNTGVGYGVKVLNCNGLNYNGNSLTLKTDTANDGYGIYAESSGNISVKNNYINFEGNTDGEAANYALSISGNPSDSSIEVAENTFDISIVSCYLPWYEVPPGSGNWISKPISGGLLFDNCHNLTVSKNIVNVSYHKTVGAYDTIYGIDIRGDKRPEGGDNPVIHITDNKVTLNGNSYAYGLNLAVDGFEVKGNEISVNSNYYSDGIVLEENCFNGLVEQNSITVGVSEEGYFSIGLYIGMYNAKMEGIVFRKNTIQLSGKIGYGIQCNSYIESGYKLRIEENIINGDGGCMAGVAIAGKGSYEIKGNSITVSGNATEEYQVWDTFYNKIHKTYGIAFIGENDENSAEVSNNTIQSSDLGIVSWIASVISGNEVKVQGEYTVDVSYDGKPESHASKVFDNCLIAAKRKGDSSVQCMKMDEVHNNFSQKVTEVFPDVKEGKWYVSAVQFVYDNGIMSGNGDGTFGTGNPLQREQLVQTLYSMEGKPAIDPASVNPFKDLKDKTKYPGPAVLWAYQVGIAGGNGDGTFGIGQSIQRQAVAVMLYKYAMLKGYDLSINDNALDRFSDVSKVADWALKPMKWAVTQGIIGGKGMGTEADPLRIDPVGKATREECATMLYKLLSANK